MIPHITSTLVQEIEDDHEHTVISIIATLSKNAQSFQDATNLYNLDFFQNEPPELKTRLCTALAQFYAPTFSNSFWDAHKQAEV